MNTLFYQPPRSQGYGHRVGRLTSVQILDLAERFRHEQTISEKPPTFNFYVRTVVGGPAFVTNAISEIENIISVAPRISMGTWPGYAGTRNYDWQPPPDKLTAVATWLDKMHACQSEPEFWSDCSVFTQFRWKSPPGSTPPSSKSGGFFGFSLGLRSVTTMFEFISVEHFRAVQRYLTLHWFGSLVRQTSATTEGGAGQEKGKASGS